MYYFFKRTLDILLSIILLILFFPVILITAIIIKLSSQGPIFVEKSNSHMKRMGKNGKIFRLYKFRSMIVNADVLEKTHPKYRVAYEEKHSSGNYKPTNDPRITPVGKFIRKHSIDEIPQLINVLKGEMSVIGPRPYLPDELIEQQQKFPGTEKYVQEMQTVKPGITGYWQTTGRSAVNFDKRIEMDAYYARRKSIWFDIIILLKSPWAMISGKGAS
jgi:lipopolysaccharide/colanic/teichoic acid biosynthesis glycosyltransferase